MEKILSINEVEDFKLQENDYRKFDGYEVVTDKQKILLLIEGHQQCCESFGYFMSKDNLGDFIGAELLEITLTDTALNTKKIDEEFKYGLDYVDLMFVNLKTNKGILQFTAYNEHNGYYGHDVKVVSEQLSHEESL